MSGKEEAAVIIKQIATKFGMSIPEAQSLDALCNNGRELVFNETSSSYHAILFVEDKITVMRSLNDVSIVVPKERGGKGELMSFIAAIWTLQARFVLVALAIIDRQGLQIFLQLVDIVHVWAIDLNTFCWNSRTILDRVQSKLRRA